MIRTRVYWRNGVVRFCRQCWSASALEEGSSTALLQSTQTALFHATTTRSTDAACSSDDSAFLCGFESVHVFAKNKAVLRHYYY